MITEIQNILTPDQLVESKSLFDKATWSDGQETAGAVINQSKTNKEVKPGSNEHRELSKIVMLALASHEEVELAIMPVGSSIPIFAKYTAGMSYPEHLDAPIVSYKNPSGSIFPARFRADVSATLFLNAPDEYEGGELLIKTRAGQQKYKGEAGSLITYPSNFLHEITEVTSGERRVAVFWFQSLFPNSEERYQLYQLRSSTNNLLQKLPEDDDVRKVNAALNTLMQMFAR